MDTESDRGSSGRVDRPGQGDGCWDGTWTKHGDEDPLFPDEHLSFTKGSTFDFFLYMTNCIYRSRSICLISMTIYGYIYIYIYPWRTPTHSPKHLQHRNKLKTISLPHLSNTLQVMMTSRTEIFILEEHIDHGRYVYHVERRRRTCWDESTRWSAISFQLESAIAINLGCWIPSKSFIMDIFSDLMLCQGMVVQLIFNRSIFCLLMLHGEIWGKFLEADVQDAPLERGSSSGRVFSACKKLGRWRKCWVFFDFHHVMGQKTQGKVMEGSFFSTFSCSVLWTQWCRKAQGSEIQSCFLASIGSWKMSEWLNVWCEQCGKLPCFLLYKSLILATPVW